MANTKRPSGGLPTSGKGIFRPRDKPPRGAQIRPREKISERPFLESWLDKNSEIAPDLPLGPVLVTLAILTCALVLGMSARFPSAALPSKKHSPCLSSGYPWSSSHNMKNMDISK